MKKNGKMQVLNIRLSDAEHARAVEVTRQRMSKRAEIVYPLILQFLKENAPSHDWRTISDPDLVARDTHWGTAAEALRPRNVPESIHRASPKVERRLTLQQRLTPESLRHLRAIERYYRVPILDLFLSALVWAENQQQ